MRILVLGGGGREHAIVAKLAESPLVTGIISAPGNAGTARLAQNVELTIHDGAQVAAFAKDNGVELVVIGPEVPLVAGVADALRVAKIPVFGPGASGAMMEGSKAFAKNLMLKYGIPTGESSAFTDRDTALSYLEKVGVPVVVKADGLAAGKGVIVAFDVETARNAINDCFDGRFGSAGSTVLIEEHLEGPECSLLVFTDGRTVIPMPPAQDHKRAFDGDLGPNTGGMGVYSPVPAVTAAEHAQMLAIMEKTVSALREESIDYRGVLYGGFMLTAEGPKVLEFNARFGDPETQVILVRMAGDLAKVMLACAQGDLGDAEIAWSDDWAVSVVLASSGYPDEYETGKPITGIEAAEQIEGVRVYHAGTALDEAGELVTAGGRALNVTAVGHDLAAARQQAYRAVELISFEGKFYRTDIGRRACLDDIEARVRP